MPGKGVRRRWYLDLHGIRREGTKERGFSYRSATGAQVDNDKTIARIRKLRIPPAWQDVRIARGDAAPLQAVGVDKKGRTQYLYHPRFRAQREEEKFRRVVEFGESLPLLRRRVRADLKRADLDRDNVLAAIVRLIDQGFFRVGNDKSAQSEATYGLTTIGSKHVKVDGDVLLFDYVGKWGKTQSRAIDDAEVAAIVQRLKKLRQSELFAFIDNGKIHDEGCPHLGWHPPLLHRPRHARSGIEQDGAQTQDQAGRRRHRRAAWKHAGSLPFVVHLPPAA
jgi:DNA topoisomerase-1